MFGGVTAAKGAEKVVNIDLHRPQWFVAHTRSRHEKRVHEQLQLKQVENFLPLYRSQRNWNGRNATVDLPLFPGYIFVRLPLVERLSVLTLGGVAGFVSVGGTPVPLPDGDLERLREWLSWAEAEPVAYFQPGNRVRITAGPLAGIEGVILRQNGQTRFVLSIDLIMRSVAVTVNASDLELVEPAAEHAPAGVLGAA